MNRRKLHAVGYIRVSKEEQVKEGFSLGAQEARIRAYCEAKGWTLHRVYRDEGISGKSLDRPGIQSLISDLKTNGVDVVVILKLDRLTRSVRDLGRLIEDLFNGVALASVEESLDSTSANGRMVINLLGTVAQWEREIISERTTTALRFKKEKGEWAGRVPYGFQIVDKNLVENPEQIKNIVAMKRASRRGQTLRSLGRKYRLAHSTVAKLVRTDLRLLRKQAQAKKTAKPSEEQE